MSRRFRGGVDVLKPDNEYIVSAKILVLSPHGVVFAEERPEERVGG